MKQVLVLEPDRIVAKCLASELSLNDFNVRVATTADEAIELANEQMPDAVVCELSLPGHSGTEFVYEFRTYTDWQDVPLVVYSSIKPASEILSSKDWQMLNIADFLYKPDASLQDVVGSIAEGTK